MNLQNFEKWFAVCLTPGTRLCRVPTPDTRQRLRLLCAVDLAHGKSGRLPCAADLAHGKPGQP